MIGKTLRDIVLLQYIKNMQALLHSQHLNIIDAMKNSEENLSPSIFKILFARSRLQVQQGSSFTNALKQPFPLPETAYKMLEVGEKSATLPVAMGHLAQYINHHLQKSLDQFIQRLGPLLLLTVGGVLIFIISAVFLPLYSGLGGLDT